LNRSREVQFLSYSVSSKSVTLTVRQFAGKILSGVIMAATARLEARVSSELHALIKHAAELQGRTVTDFIVTATQEAAKRAVEETALLRLAIEDQQQFATSLLEESVTPPTLLRAMARRKELGK
jgi:uncharacterized protein (DUF1778 family)